MFLTFNHWNRVKKRLHLKYHFSSELFCIIMVVCLQGNGITENGLLIKKSDVLCYKRGHNILKSTLRRRPKSKSCQIFIFEKGIVLAEKVYDAVGADRGQSFVLKHLTTFTVSKINLFLRRP